MRASLVFLASSIVLGTIACAKKPAPASTTTTSAPAETAAAAVPGGGALEANDPRHGTRKLKNLDAPVFVDGVQVAVLRYGDLPSIPSTMLVGGTPSFRLYDYLKGIGVSPEKVRAVHFHGNNDRIGGVLGTELLADKDRFTFTFSSQTTGTPTQRWSASDLANSFSFHEIRKMSVFVTKAPAPVDPQRRCHLDGEGKCTTAVPYAEADAAKGTRFVVDGRMVGFVKRRHIGDDLILGTSESGDPAFALAKLATSFGVPRSGVRAVELVAGDDVVARATPAQWERLAPSLSFTLQRHQHGKVKVQIPPEIQAPGASTTADAYVSAVVFYVKSAPTSREVVAASEDTDLAVQLASNDAPSAGDRREDERHGNERN